MLTEEQKIAQHALTILVNLAAEKDILEYLATDEKFLNVVFARITVRLPIALILAFQTRACGVAAGASHGHLVAQY